jgi:hypothetical protein
MPATDSTKRNPHASKFCAACGVEFMVKMDYGQTCCPKCATKISKFNSKNNIPAPTHPCRGCQTPIKISAKKLYCSPECRHTDLRVNKVCQFCGKTFSILKSVLGPTTNSAGSFCSKQCYTEHKKTLVGEKNHHYNSVIQQCGHCNKEIKVIKCKSESVRFCSLDCRSAYHIGRFAGERNPLWKGGHKKYKSDFESVKTKHFSGLLFCAQCGTTKKIHIHHIIPFRYTQDNSLSNLIPLCASCHRKVELISWSMLESADWGDMQLAKALLNISLRERQLMTHARLKKLYSEIQITNHG